MQGDGKVCFDSEPCSGNYPPPDRVALLLHEYPELGFEEVKAAADWLLLTGGV